MLGARRIALLVLWAITVTLAVGCGSSIRPVIACGTLRNGGPEQWSWASAPSGLCELEPSGPPLVGIDGAHWHSWGQERASATGSFVDGLGFQYPATITAYGLTRCSSCDGVRAPRAYYRKLHIVSAGGARGGAVRGPFDLTLDVGPRGAAAQ